jgi:hypothetical protein
MACLIALLETQLRLWARRNRQMIEFNILVQASDWAEQLRQSGYEQPQTIRHLLRSADGRYAVEGKLAMEDHYDGYQWWLRREIYPISEPRTSIHRTVRLAGVPSWRVITARSGIAASTSKPDEWGQNSHAAPQSEKELWRKCEFMTAMFVDREYDDIVFSRDNVARFHRLFQFNPSIFREMRDPQPLSVEYQSSRTASTDSYSLGSVHGYSIVVPCTLRGINRLLHSHVNILEFNQEDVFRANRKECQYILLQTFLHIPSRAAGRILDDDGIRHLFRHIASFIPDDMTLSASEENIECHSRTEAQLPKLVCFINGRRRTGRQIFLEQIGFVHYEVKKHSENITDLPDVCPMVMDLSAYGSDRLNKLQKQLMRDGIRLLLSSRE